MLRQHEHKLLSTNTNNNRRKQEHSQTNTDTEDRRQGHHNSLEPITVDPWCMHTNKDLQKYKLELHVNIIYVLETTHKWLNKFTWCVAF